MKTLKELFINLGIFLFPLVYVYFQNFVNYDYKLYIPSLALFTIIYLIFFFLISLIYFLKVINFEKFKIINSTFFSFFTLSFFISYHFSITNFTHKLILAFLMLLFLTFIFFKFKKLNFFILQFLFFFVILNIFYININKSNNYEIPNNLQNIKNIENNNTKNLLNKREEKLPNLYLIILDKMTSPKILLETYNINVEDYINKNKFNIFSGKSNYRQTRNSLSNFFYEKNLHKHIKGGKYMYDIHPNLFYPFGAGIDEPNFLLHLINLNYKITSVGNYYVRCMEVYNIKCLEYLRSYYPFDFTIKQSFFTRLFEDLLIEQIELIKNFTTNIFISDYKNKDDLFNIFKNKNYNDLSINHFQKHLKLNHKILNLQNTSNAFIIHEWTPHDPYRKPNCELYEYLSPELNTKKKRFKRYSNSVVCALKKVNNLLEFIIKIDKKSIIFVFADHGNEFISTKFLNNENYNKQIQTVEYPNTKDIIILSRLTDECKDIKENINNISQITKIIRKCLKFSNKN